MVTCGPHSVVQKQQNNPNHYYVALHSWKYEEGRVIKMSTVLIQLEEYMVTLFQTGHIMALVNAISSTTQGWFLPVWKQHFLPSMLHFRRVWKSTHVKSTHNIFIYRHLVILFLFFFFHAECLYHEVASAVWSTSCLSSTSSFGLVLP